MTKQGFVKQFRLGLLAITLVSTWGAVSFAVSPEARQLYDNGVKAYTQGNQPEAIQLFEKATQADPAYTDAYYNLASVHYQLQQYKKASEAYIKVLQINPNDAQTRYNLGLTYEKMNQPGDALREFQTIPSSYQKYTQAQAKVKELTLKVQAQAQAKANAQPAAKPTPAAKPVATKPTATKPVAAKPTAAKQTAAKSTPAKSMPAKAVATQATAATAAATSPPKFTVETYANGFSGPTGMAVGKDGMLYVANYSKNSIDRVTTDGKRSVFVEGNGLAGPIGLVMDPRNGNIYVANYLKNNIVRITPSGEVTAMAGGLNKPYNLFLDTLSNTLYVTEQESNSVSRIQLQQKS